MGNYFKVFSSCFLVEGAAANVIHDTERNEFYDIPHEVKTILLDSNGHTIRELKERHGNVAKRLLDQFVDMELGFYTKEPELFPEINLSWESPYHVKNAILEISLSTSYNFKNAIKELDGLGCREYQLRFLEFWDKGALLQLFEIFDDSRATGIEVLYPYNRKIEEDFFVDMVREFPRIAIVKVYAAPHSVIKENTSVNGKICYFEKDIRSDSNEIMSPERLMANITMYTEAQHYNLGLNRKVAITKNGEIKNYPDHTKVHGHIGTDNLSAILASDSFNWLWEISKDKITTCMDCQYRYACTDNSEITIEGNSYIKNRACSFDPYKNSWSQSDELS